MKLPCPACGKEVDLNDHFATSSECESEALRQSNEKIKAYDEKLHAEDPERYAMIQKLRDLKPVAGSDPDFDYPVKT